MFFSHRRILSLPVSPGSLSFQSSRKGTPTYSPFPHLFIVALHVLGLAGCPIFRFGTGTRGGHVSANDFVCSSLCLQPAMQSHTATTFSRIIQTVLVLVTVDLK